MLLPVFLPRIYPLLSCFWMREVTSPRHPSLPYLPITSPLFHINNSLSLSHHIFFSSFFFLRESRESKQENPSFISTSSSFSSVQAISTSKLDPAGKCLFLFPLLLLLLLLVLWFVQEKQPPSPVTLHPRQEGEGELVPSPSLFRRG